MIMVANACSVPIDENIDGLESERGRIPSDSAVS